MALLQVIHVYNNSTDETVSEEGLKKATELLIENEKVKLNATALMSLGYVSATAALVSIPSWILTSDQAKDVRAPAIICFIVLAAILSIFLFWLSNRNLKKLR
jgi:hypothetical protein